jgi:hypothetical protein
MTHKTLPRFRTAGLLLAMSASAHAAAFQGTAYEGFDYTAGTITPPNPVADVPALLNGGTGFNATGTADANAAWDAALGGGWGNVGRAAVAEVIDPPTPAVTAIIGSPNGAGGPVREIDTAGLTIPTAGYLTPTGLALKLNGAAGSANIGRHLGQDISEGTFYVSYLTNRTVNGALRSTNVAFYREGTELFAFGQHNSDANFTLSWSGNGIVAPSVSGVATAPTPIVWTTGQTYLVVLKFEINQSGNNDRVTAWINPTDLANDYNNPIYMQDSRDIGSRITGFRPFVGSQSSGNTAIFDEFRFGPTFNSVLTATTPTPKPALAFTTHPEGATNVVDVAGYVPTYTPINLTAAANLPGASLQWLRDGVEIAGATGATFTVAEPNITHAGTYTCRATFDTEVVTSNAAVVTVNAPSLADDDGDALPDAVEVLLKPFGFDVSAPNGVGAVPDLVTRFLAIDFSVAGPGGTPEQALQDVQTANPDNPILPPVAGKFNLQVAVQQTTDLAVAPTDLTSATITGSNVTVSGDQVKVTLPAPAGARQFNNVSATAAP